MQIRKFTIILLVALMVAGCGAVNRSIQIADGEEVEGDVRNVNGAIRIGNNCTISGDVRNVNGAIVVGTGTRLNEIRNTNGAIDLANDVQASTISGTNGRIRIGQGSAIDGSVANTNGAIELAEDVTVSGSVETTNGPVRVAAGAHITGTVSSRNGPITLTAARAGDIAGANGGIELLEGTVVDGEVHLRDTRGTDRSGTPKIIIGQDVIVEGPIRIEREAELYIHESSRTGEISGAEPVRFSGEQP